MTLRIVHVASGRKWRGGQKQVWLLARALQRLRVDQVVVTSTLTDAAFAAELVKIGARTVESHSDHAMAERMLAVYRSRSQATGNQ